MYCSVSLTHNKMTMIQLLGWICFMHLLSPALSDTALNVGSNFTFDTSTTVNLVESTMESTTGSPSTSETNEPIGIASSSSFGTDIKLENIQLSEDLSTNDAMMPSEVNTLEPVYGKEITITYQSTTENLKESRNGLNPTTSSVYPYSNKILYMDEKTTTEKGVEKVVVDESSRITVIDIGSQSKTSMALFGEESSKPTFNEASKLSASETTLFTAVTDEDKKNNSKITSGTNRLSVETVDSPNMSAYRSVVSVLAGVKQGSSYSINKKTDSVEIDSNDKDNQTHSSIFVPTSTDISVTETLKYDETSSTLKNTEENLENRKVVKNLSEDQTKDTQTSSIHEIPLTDLATHNMDGSLVGLSEVATETINNSTRNPKKIQEDEEFEERYPEGRKRPIVPDPGYANYQDETVRPYRPDVPLHKYPYYRPTPDYRTHTIREDTRPARPDPEYPRVSFRPNYLHSKTSHDNISPMPMSVFATSPNPYKPSYHRPAYYPQSSFGRPFRPDYNRPSSKPTEDYSVTKISEIKGGYTPDADVHEHSRADYDYTKLSDMLPTYTKIYKPDTKSSAASSDLTKSYGPSYDAEMSMHSKATSPDDLMSAIREMAKVSKPDINTNRPANFYPRPGFGNNYQASDPSMKPFSVGTVTSAKNLTRVEFIKADCFDNHMKVTMRFNGTFNGLVYSSGYASDSSCSYVNGSGRNHYEFYIRLNRCGTLGQQDVAEQRMRSISRRRQERAQYLVNTVTVQYNPVIEEDIDEHFRVTCEYGYDFWKTVTFPVMSVESSAVKVRTGSPVVFTLPPPQCNMEIRNGFGPSGTRVSGPVNVGDPLTLVIHMKSESTGFDILVKNCYAHNGAQKRLQLIDSNGCVIQEKLVSAFRGVHSPDRSQQITLYSYLKAFRFTGSPALYIECDVHMCHGSCPPQRCYWRHLYKRSANEVTTQTSSTVENVVSESVSLFQALEVRHEEAESPYLLSLQNPNDVDDVVCLKTGGFAAILACLLLLLVITTFVAICMCLRMRKMKKLIESPDANRFVEFDGHVPKK